VGENARESSVDVVRNAQKILAYIFSYKAEFFKKFSVWLFWFWRG